MALYKAAGEHSGYFHLVIQDAVYAEVYAEQLSRLDHIVAHGVAVYLADGGAGIEYALGAVVNSYRLLGGYARQHGLAPAGEAGKLMRLDLAYLHMDIALIRAAVDRDGRAVCAVAEIDEIIPVKRRVVYALHPAVQLAEGTFHLILGRRTVNADGDEKRDALKLDAASYELLDGSLRHGSRRYSPCCVRNQNAGCFCALFSRDIT